LLRSVAPHFRQKLVFGELYKGRRTRVFNEVSLR